MNASTPTRDHIDVLDGWRGLAVILVLIGHFFPMPGLNLARLGVDLFFALSGRLMAGMLFEREIALPLFFFRRFTRVYPALLVFVVVAALVFNASAIRVGPIGIVSALTFTINYVSILGHRTGLFDHLWSLCVEEHSYLMLGALAFLARRFGAPVKAILLVASVLAIGNGVIQSDVLGRDYYDVFWRTDVQAGSIFIGALVFLTRERWLNARTAAATPIFVALAVFAKASVFGAAVRFGLGTICLATAVTALETSPAWFQSLLSAPPLRRAGLWSFSLYLWQQPFYELHERGQGLWTLGAAILLGVASFHVVEQPARRWLNARYTPARPVLI